MEVSNANDAQIVIINACIDRRLKAVIDGLVLLYRKAGWEVRVINTGGGNPAPIEDKIEEAKDTGRLRLVINIPHIDCKWVQAAANVLYFGGKASDVLREEYMEVFREFDANIKPRDKANREKLKALHGRMELWAKKHFADKWRTMLSDLPNFNFDTDFIQGHLNAIELEKYYPAITTEGHGKTTSGSGENIMLFVEPTGSTSRELAEIAHIPAKDIVGTYIATMNVLYQAELPVGAKRIIVCGVGDLDRYVERLRAIPVVAQAERRHELTIEQARLPTRTADVHGRAARLKSR